MTVRGRTTDYRAMLVSLVRRVLLVSVLPLIVIAAANFLLFFSFFIGLTRRPLSGHRENVLGAEQLLRAEIRRWRIATEVLTLLRR